MKNTMIRTDGTSQKLSPVLTLNKAGQLIQGYAEVVPITINDQPHLLIVDAEGLIKNLPPNPHVTKIPGIKIPPYLPNPPRGTVIVATMQAIP